ncbi:TorF family putative porin [Erythrobacter sp. GH1-10]|uniref:TorF family putative porin n=1 Tax=Erythrobacter sp. GH1-10 TaxID=3349334 RepID=UPI00387825B7
MLTSIRGLTAATFSAGLLLSAAPAFASDTTEEANTKIQAGEVEVSEELLAASAKLDDIVEGEKKLALTPSIDRASAPVDEAKSSGLQDDGESSAISFSANIAFATEYRFRGVALTDGEFAVQGGFDIGHESGLYIGTWASNLDEQTVGYGSAELDLYGGWGGDLTDGVSADVGVIYYLYPDATGPGDFDYIEFYGSLGFSLGPASLTGGIAYAPDQDSLGGTDNLYLYADVGIGIPDTPITINGHIGYTDGFLTFTTDSEAIDWSIGADLAVGPATLSAAYVGVEGDVLIDPTGTFTDDAFVVTLSASF